MALVKLSEYIKEYSEKNKNNQSYPVYSVTNREGFCTEYFSKDISSEDKSSYKIVPRGYFAYNPSRINVGSVDWQKCEDNVIVSPLYVVFECSEELDQEYLKYFLKSKETRRIINANTSGSVRNSFSIEDVGKLELKIETLGEQQKKVHFLKRIEEAIDNENKLVSLYNELIETRFVELFEKDLEKTVLKIGDIADECTVGIANSATHAYSETGVVLLRNQNIRVNELDDRDLIFITEEFADKYKKKALKENDILVTRTGANVGMACLVPLKYEGCQTFTTLILRLKHDIGISPLFVCHYINSRLGKRFIDDKKVGGAQPNFGAKQLASMPIAFPDALKQETFEILVKKIEKLKLEAEQRKGFYLELFEKEIYQIFYN